MLGKSNKDTRGETTNEVENVTSEKMERSN